MHHAVKAIQRIKQNETVEELYQPHNLDLVAWFVVG
jgi:hypothetical protein